MTKTVCIAIAFLLVFPAFSQAAEEDTSAETTAAESTEIAAEDATDESDFGDESDDFDDFDSLFDDAEDTAAVVTEEKESGTVTAKIGDISIPLSWSGYLESSIGAGDVHEDGEDEYSGYFTFLNYLYLNARPDKTLSIHASLRTYLPANSALSVYEIYFTYLMFDRVFITAGRKDTSWGYVRLIGTSNDDDDSSDSTSAGLKYKYGGVSTDILSDSRNGTSGLVRIPFLTGTISGWAYYADTYGSASNMDTDKMSFAVSLEETILKTSINLFARKYPSVDNTGTAYTDENRTLPIAGAEIKRTILDADIYAQAIGQIHSVGDVVKRHDINGFGAIIMTAGLYRWWDKRDPNVGFNVEFQDSYYPPLESHTRVIAYDAGIKRLGKNHNIKLGVSGYHSFTANNGYVKPGIILSGIFPHATWENGVRIDYGESSSYVSPKLTFGSYIKITLNY